MSARPGRVSSWLTYVRREPDERPRRRPSASARAPRAGSRRASACRSSRPREGARESRARGRSRGRRRARSPRPARPPGTASPTTAADERQPQPAEALAAAGASVARRRSRSCRPRWPNPRTSRPVARCSRSSSTSATRSPARAASIVIRVSTPNPAATGKSRRARGAREARAGPTAARGREADRAGATSARGDRLGDPEAAARAARRRRRSRGRRRPRRAVSRSPRRSASQSRSGPRGALALGERQRLALAPPRQPDDARPGLRRPGSRLVARAVVGDDDLGLRERCAQRRHRVSDPRLLVARGDEDGQPVRHSPTGGCTAAGAGRTPSTAVLPRP